LPSQAKVLTHETTETTRSARKVGFIRKKGKAAPRDGRGPGKSVAHCHLQRGVFHLVLFVGESGLRGGVVFGICL
jgi:hypothetical protein